MTDSSRRLLSGGRHLEFVRAIRREGGVGPGLLFTRGQILVSTSVLEEIREVESDAAALYVLGAHVWGEDGGELEGIEILRCAHEQGSTDATASLGESLHWMGDYVGAARYLTIAVADPAATAWSHGLLGEALLALNASARAEDHLRRGLDEYPEFGLGLGKLLEADGRTDEAIQVLREAVAAGVYGAPIRLGNLYEERGHDREALEAFTVGAEQGDGHSAFNLGLLLRLLGDYPSARAAFALAAELGDMTVPPPLDSGGIPG